MKRLSRISILILLMVFSGCRNSDSISIKEIDFTKEINKISLKIYYIPLTVLTNLPINKEMIKNSHYYNIEILGDALRGFQNYFEELKKVDYSPKKEKNTFDYRIYCEIYKKNKLVMTFGLEGAPESPIIINDRYYIRYNDVFYKIIKTFIPTCAKDEF